MQMGAGVAGGQWHPPGSFCGQSCCGSRMLVNTESNILMFQFENIKWQYSQERTKQKKNKEREEDKEENSLTEVLSKASTQAYSLKGSTSSKQVVAQESLLSKPHRSRIQLRTVKLPTGRRTDSWVPLLQNRAGVGGGGAE